MARGKPLSPVKIRRVSGWRGNPVWMWSCTEHRKSRGYYPTRRRVKATRKDWERCLAGANIHHHRHHSGGCTCPEHRKLEAS